MLVRLPQNRFAVLAGITLRSISSQQFTECNGAQTSHLRRDTIEKTCNRRPDPVLLPESNSKEESNLHGQNNFAVAACGQPKSDGHPNRVEESSPNGFAELLNSRDSPHEHAESDKREFSNTHGDAGVDKIGESEIITLWGSYRVRGGKLQELRKNGMVPGIVSDYDAERGTNYNYYIALQRKEVWGHLTRMGRKDFMSRFYNLALRDRPDSDLIEHTVKVFPSKLYLIEGRRSILNLAFVRVRHNVKLRMIIPLKFRGRTVCPGLIKGGTLVVLKKALSCFVFPDEVPPYIEVDVSKLKVGDRILVNDLDVDLQYHRQAGHVVCEVKKYRFVRPNRSRSLARSSSDIGPPKYSW